MFVDLYDIKPGEDWLERIIKSIAESDIVAVIVTRSALKSSEIEKEILEARKLNKIIIPCRYRGIPWSDLKWELNKYQGFQFDNKNSLIRQLDDIIFSETGTSNPIPISEVGGDDGDIQEKVGSHYKLSSKTSKKIIVITVISIIAITVVIGILPFLQPKPPISVTPDVKNENETGGGAEKPSTPSPSLQPPPPSVDDLFATALSAFKIGQYSDAVSSFNKVLQIEPNNVTAQFLKGSSLYYDKKYSDAVPSFNKVLQIDSNSTNALLYNGLSLYNLERYNEAIAQLNRLLAVEPTNTNALLYKGLSLYNLERYNEAIAYFDIILEIEPDNINATKEKEKIQQIQQNQSNINNTNN